MSEVKLPDINGARGKSRGSEGRSNGGMKRQASFSSALGGAGGQSKSAFVAKKERKDVERDAQLLANRIALLKQEEMKTWKKIEETKRRATEVVKLKQKNEVRAQQKFGQMQAQSIYQQQASNKIRMMRQQREIEKKKITEAIFLHKKEEAKQAKFVGEQHKQRYQQQMYQNSQENDLKNKLQKQQERIQKAKVEEYRRQKHEAAREEVARKIIEEENIIKQKEAEVMQMEMLEMELIKKLQNTQAIQKQAYTELEEAINTRPLAGNSISNNDHMDPGQQINMSMGNMNLNDGGQGDPLQQQQ